MQINIICPISISVTFHDYPLGCETKQIGGYQISASSYLTESGKYYLPSAVRLGSAIYGAIQKAWRPSPKTATDQWIQFDLLSPHNLTSML